MGKLHIAVIGAGISGLACGRALSEAGAGVVVFEKSRSLGGRLATRRWEGKVVDHGPPWFSGVPPALRDLCQGDLRRVAAPVLDLRRGQALPEPQGGRWYLPEGNNRLGKLLAQGLEVRQEMLVESLERMENGSWLVAGEAFACVVLTAPWPQTHRLLAPIGTGVTRDAAEAVYRRTLTAFFEYDRIPPAAAVAWSGMVHEENPSGLERSICENHKMGRVPDGRTVIVAHGTADFSAEHFEAEPKSWAARLECEVREAWGLNQPARAQFTHRWGYSMVDEPLGKMPDLPEGIFLAGDAVSGSAVGAVYNSGVAAAAEVLAGRRRTSA